MQTTHDLLHLTGTADRGWSRRSWRLAWADLCEGVSGWEVWTMLGWGEIRRRYRRSALGPFWITLSMVTFIGFVSLLYARLLNASHPDYIPYVAASYLTWTMIAAFLNEGPLTFVGWTGYLQQMRFAKSTFVMAVVWRNLMMFLHHLPVVLVVLLWFGVYPTAWTLLLIPGMLALLMLGAFLALILGMVGARFRDLASFTQSLVTMLFFFTPILYRREVLGQYSYLVDWNPLGYFLDAVRAPLMGQPPDALTWPVVSAVLLLLGAAAFAMFARYRPRITYWL